MKQIVLRVEEPTYEMLKDAIPQLKGVQVMECVDVANTVKNTAVTSMKRAKAPTKNVTFTERVKAIVIAAASKNGERVVTNGRGHAGEYTYYINDSCFCAAMDELEKGYREKILDYLGGSLLNVDAGKVCTFIGRVIKMNIINDKSLQLSDVSFALETYYKASTAKSRMGRKKLSDEERVLFGAFEGLLKRYIS